LPSHEHFEELAAIGVKGELTPSEEQELALHLADCPQCSQVCKEYEELHAPLRPLLDPKMEILLDSRQDKVRSAVLKAIGAIEPQLRTDVQPAASLKSASIQWSTLRPAWIGLAMAMAMGLAFWVGVRYESHTVRVLGETRTANSAESTPGVAVPAAMPPSASHEQTQDPQYSQVLVDLRTERQRVARLDAAIIEKDRELAASENAAATSQQQLDAESNERRQTQALLATKTDQLNQMQAAKSNDSANVVALQYQVQDLTQKLNDQKDSLERERQLLANGRDIRDIIGARNLHIIDVYDTDPGGNTRKSFARAFYTEGKSLIFYAYDLPARDMDNGKFVYAAWGEKNGSKKTLRNLGILLNDDKGQKRWVLNLSDPKVLAEIDSVFVTLERTGTDSEQPSGKRMLTAYLNSQVNHP
jgi:hypothetical protein